MMMTWVTPTAMMPISASCRIMILSRSRLKMKVWPSKIQPSASNSSIMPIMTPRMLISGGSRRRPALGDSVVAAAVEVSVATVPGSFPFSLQRYCAASSMILT